MAQEERGLMIDIVNPHYDGEDIVNRQISQYPLSAFTGENDFTHATQDEDHGSRRDGPGIGAIGKPYRLR